MSQLSQQDRTAVFDIKNLRTWYPLRKGMFKRHVGDVKAVDDLSLTVYKGETLGVVGESGCGKSTLGKSIMRLENPTGGEVLYNFDGEFKDIMRFDRQELFQFRKRVQMVFQTPIPRSTRSSASTIPSPSRSRYTATRAPRNGRR